MPLASVTKVADADFPTRWGHFRILGFEGLTTPGEPNRQPVESAVALVMGDISTAANNKPRRPSCASTRSALTGDVFHSLRCDCHDQLHLALARIAEEGAGILLYEQQEGRGIGLMAKLRAYELQDQGLDTIEANLELGFQADHRNFELPAAILNTSASPPSASSPTTPRKSKPSKPPASKSSSASPPKSPSNPPSSATSKPSATKWATSSDKKHARCSAESLICDDRPVFADRRWHNGTCMSSFSRGEFEINLTDDAVDVTLNASAQSPHAKLGGIIFVVCMSLCVPAFLLFVPDKYGTMWHDITAPRTPSDRVVALACVIAAFGLVWLLCLRWAAAAWPSDERFHCDRNILTLARVPLLDFKNRKWESSSFPLGTVSKIRYAVYASAKGSSIYGLRFLVDGRRHKVLPDLEAPEAQKILSALQHLGADVLLDNDLQKKVDEALANRNMGLTLNP